MELGFTFPLSQELLEPASLDPWQTHRTDLLMKQEISRSGLKLLDGWVLVLRRAAPPAQTLEAGHPLQLYLTLQSSALLLLFLASKEAALE